MVDFKILNNYLYVLDGEKHKPLNAEQSFEFLKNKANNAINISVEFAHYEVTLSNILGESEAKLEFKLRHKEIEFSLDHFDGSRDYYVTENQWFPIDIGELEELNQIFLECGIDFEHNLTVAQALFLSVQSTRLNCKFINNWRLREFIPKADRDFEQLVKAVPFPYQEIGYRWLAFLRNLEVGGILGDEMGLGKTLQAIMLIESEIRQNKKPNLVVCPPSLTENWKREIAKFTGRMAYVHQGSDRSYDLEILKSKDLVIVSYDTLRRDRQLLSQVKWNVVTADEAQYIKNPSSERSVSVKMLPKRMGLAITGTPIETSLSDIWSISDFTIPGVLGEHRWFKKTFEDDIDNASRIRSLIKPLILRRRVMEVAKDLPNVIKLEIPISLPKDLLEEYLLIKNQSISGMGEALRIAGELRQVSCHIQRSSIERQVISNSGKFEYLENTLPQLFSQNLKVIIFSPYTISTEYLAKWLKASFGNIYVDIIYGATQDKQSTVDEFTKSSVPGALVINPKAGGVGLNITAANHVFHFAPDWNPAVLDQANARAYRRGQDRPVTIHNLFYSDSIEERMIERVNLRRALSETALEGTDVGPTFEELKAAIENGPRY